MGGFGFAEQVDPEPCVTRPGRYRVTLTDKWNAPFLPHGGLTAAIAARAMERELASPEQPLRTITTTFVSKIPPGEVNIEVSVLRRGRSISQATATMYNPEGAVGLLANAVFGAPRPGFAFTDTAMPPGLPQVDDCPSFDDTPDDAPGLIPASLWDRINAKLAMGHPPWANPHPTTSEQAYWYRFAEPPLRPGGHLDPLAYLVLCDTMIGSVTERMGSGLPVWLAPSADLTVHLLGETRTEWILARNRAKHAGDGYVSLEIELWDPDRNALLATGSQLALFSFPNGDVRGSHPAPE